VNTDAVTLFLALLAVAAEIAVVVVVVMFLLGRFSVVREVIGPQALTLAFVVALVATAGSLYFSEIAHFTPCTLCWYQRICMYPLVPVLGVAAWRRDSDARPTALILALVGGSISIYHILIEHFPSLESNTCDPTNPCTIKWVERFGYLTIPTMALSGFALIVVLVLTSPRSKS
jgi:disulfide bond formation protein DsbB